jgi:hypothetical protein
MQRILITRARPALVVTGSATAAEIDQRLADLELIPQVCHSWSSRSVISMTG